MTEPKTTINISELAKLFKKDRTTIRTWLEEEGIKPISKAKTNSAFDYELAKTAIERRLNLKLKDAKTEKEVELLTIKVQKEKGEYGSVAEFAELTQDWVKWLHNQLSVKMPRQVIRKVAKSKNETEAIQILQSHIDSIFNEFRANPKKFLDAK